MNNIDILSKKVVNIQSKETVSEVKEHLPKLRPLPPYIKTLSEDEIIEPIDWLIKGFIEKGEIVVFGGDSGSGKTLHLINLCMHLVNGMDFMDLKTEPCGVYYVLGEGSRGFSRRVRAWRLNNVMQGKIIVSHQSYNLDDKTDKFIEDFRHIKAHHPNIKHWVVVFDTLNRNLSPGADENSNAGLGKAINKLIDDVKPLGVTVLFAHHTNKQGTLRGFGGLRNNVDITIECKCKQDGEDKIYTLTMDKVKEGNNDKEYKFIGKEIDLNLSDGSTSYTLDYHGENKKKVTSKSKGKVKDKPSDIARREYLKEFIKAAGDNQWLPSSWSPSKEWKEKYLCYASNKNGDNSEKLSMDTREGQITINTRLFRIKTYHKEEGNIKGIRNEQSIVFVVTDKGLHQTV